MDNWAIVPWIDNAPMTLQAVEDLLAQTLPTRVLLVDQGSGNPARQQVDDYVDQRGDHRVLCWHWRPKMPSLSGAWNRALEFVWGLGGTEALVANADVRIHPQTYEYLQKVQQKEQALFVSAVGVREAQFDPAKVYTHYDFWDAHSDRENAGYLLHRGGPDFSCFLLSKEGHQKYPFDEGFVPAYGDDVDTHRRYLLGGDGSRIFSVNLPFHHIGGGSQTIKHYSEAQRAQFNRQYDQCRAYYARCWGGPVNEETFVVKGDPSSAREGVTTPELQRRVQAGEPVLG